MSAIEDLITRRDVVSAKIAALGDCASSEKVTQLYKELAAINKALKDPTMHADSGEGDQLSAFDRFSQGFT